MKHPDKNKSSESNGHTGSLDPSHTIDHEDDESDHGDTPSSAIFTTDVTFDNNIGPGATATENNSTLMPPSLNISSVIPPSPQMTIQRNALNLAQFNSKFIGNVAVGQNAMCPLDPTDLPGLLRPPTPVASSTFKFSARNKKYKTQNYWASWLLNFIPIIGWMREYDIKSDLIADILCGITVAIFQVPQSMGYCLIARVPPVHGLYTAFFPALVYSFLGTGKHCAVGAFAIVSGVMTGHLVTAVSEEIKSDLLQLTPDVNLSDPNVFNEDDVHVTIATSASLWMAVYMLAFGFLRLGMISIYLSPQSISGFQTAASIYVFTSQLSHLTGVNLGAHSGLFAIPKNWIEVVTRYKEIKPPTIIISVVMIVLLTVFKVVINEWLMKLQKNICGGRNKKNDPPVDKCGQNEVSSALNGQSGGNNGVGINVQTVEEDEQGCQRVTNVNVINGQSSNIVLNDVVTQDDDTPSAVKCTWNPLPFPIELIVVIVMTVASHSLYLEENYDVHVVGQIKQGFPDPKVPTMDIFRRVWMRSIPLALVGYVITLSVGQFYGGKHGYTVNPNQELIALGACNLLGSCFGCLPSAASLPRSAIQENAGGKTQLVSLVNCAAMLLVLFLVGSLLEQLPNCVLASIISVALIGLIGQVRNVYRLWRVSHGDSLQWLFSFLAVIILDVDNGLYAGTAFSLLVLVYQSSSPKSYILGSSVTASAPDVYVPIKMYPGSRESTGIKIFQFCGPLHFSSRGSFRSALLSQCNLKGVLNARKNKSTCNKQPQRLPHGDQSSSVNHRHPHSQNHHQQEQQLPIATTTKSELITHLILDFSMISYVDSSGIDTLRALQEEMSGCNIKVYIANCAPHVVAIVTRDSRFMDILRPECVFISVHDALLHALEEQRSRTTIFRTNSTLSS